MLHLRPFLVSNKLTTVSSCAGLVASGHRLRVSTIHWITWTLVSAMAGYVYGRPGEL